MASKDKKVTIIALTEKIYELLINFLINFVVIRMLHIESYAVITIIAGYSTFIGFINIAPETQLFKVFHGIKSHDLDEKIASYLRFDLAKGMLIELIYIAIGLFLSLSSSNPEYLIYASLFGLCQIEELIWQLFRMVMELKYLQAKLIIVTVVSRTLKLILLLIFYKTHLLIIYSMINLFVVLCESLYGISKYGLKKIYNAVLAQNTFSIREMLGTVSQFALLNHISGVLNSIIYASDTVFLSFFVSQAIIGHYGVVLSALNYINVIFQVFQKQVSIALGNSGSISQDISIVKKFMKYSVPGSLFVILSYIAIGKIALNFYAGTAYIDNMYYWGIFIIIGTNIFNAVRPMFAFIIYKGNLLDYLLKTLTPVFVIMLCLYYFMSRQFGAFGMAIANTIVYSVWGISILFSFIKNTYHSSDYYKG